jgi:hypothetical protein
MDGLISENNALVALMAAYLIQWMKDSPQRIFAWISSEHPGVVRWLSAVVAALTAAGFTFDYIGGTLMIGGLTLANVGTLLWTSVGQFAMQHFAFRVGISLPRKLAR